VGSDIKGFIGFHDNQYLRSALKEMNPNDFYRRSGAGVLLVEDPMCAGRLVIMKRHDTESWKCHKKWIALERSGLISSSFRAPKVLRYDDETDSTILEYIPGHQQLSATIAHMNREQVLLICHQVGRALAELHRTFWMMETKTVSLLQDILGLNDEFARTLDEESMSVLVHGDFGLGNILVNKQSPCDLVIIDPEPSFLDIPVEASTSPCLDVAHFVADLEGVIPLTHYPYYSWQAVEAFQKAFLSGYQETFGQKASLRGLNLVAYHLLHRYLRAKKSLREQIRSMPSQLWLMIRARRLLRKEWN
jgi:tRNA A-37 threonylcarbamoyl transferase component Bud32